MQSFTEKSAPEQIRVFGLQSGRSFAEQAARSVGVRLSRHEERNFEDGEHKIRTLENVRGCDVYVIHSLYSDDEETVNDKLCKLLFFLSSLKDAGAKRLTAVIPYLAYARKDRQTKDRDPVTTRYIAQLIEAAGVDSVVTMDVHNLAAFQNAFRCHTEHLEFYELFSSHVTELLSDKKLPVIIVSPDAGGYKRAEKFRESFSRRLGRELPMAYLEKKRSEGVVSGETLVGDVEGHIAIIVDDLISTGGTLVHAAQRCRTGGANQVWAVATHGLFTGDASSLLTEPALERVIITNSVGRLPDGAVQGKITVLDATSLIGKAIRLLHTDGSIVQLLSQRKEGDLPEVIPDLGDTSELTPDSV